MPRIAPKHLLTVYAASLAAFFALDMIWLGFAAKGFYADHLGYLLAADVRWGAALLFYLLYLAGLVHFVIGRTLETGASASAAAFQGAAFGLVTYAAFDLTCLALIRDFPVVVVVVDLAWGAVLGALVSSVGFRVGVALTSRP